MTKRKMTSFAKVSQIIMMLLRKLTKKYLSVLKSGICRSMVYAQWLKDNLKDSKSLDLLSSRKSLWVAVLIVHLITLSINKNCNMSLLNKKLMEKLIVKTPLSFQPKKWRELNWWKIFHRPIFLGLLWMWHSFLTIREQLWISARRKAIKSLQDEKT